MNQIEIIYFSGCPKADAVIDTLSLNGFKFVKTLQNVLAPTDPRHSYSSPSVLVEGIQVIGSSGCKSGACSFEDLSEHLILQKVTSAFPKNRTK